MSDLTISDVNVELFDKLKTEKYYSYILFGLSPDNSTLEFRGSGDKNYNFDSIASELPKEDVMFVICDLEYETDENPPRKTSKLILISWCPILAQIRRRFALASGQNQLKASFIGIQKDFQLTEYEEVSFAAIRRELLK